MSDIPAFAYRDLWAERSIRSVANLTRTDGAEFFKLLAGLSIRTRVERFAALDANLAVQRLRAGDITGAAVLDWSVADR